MRADQKELAARRPHWTWPVATIVVAWLLLYPASAQQIGNAIVNLRQLNGTAIDTNSGTKSAGTQRVVLATDQPQLTNKLLVTPDANSAVNISQMNGVTVTMGNGASGTGVQRVTLANDSTGIVALTTSTAQIGHLEANQSSNVAQMNGVTVLMGNGATGTGSQRVTPANDSTGIANWGHGATGAAPPTGATQIAGVTSGATGGFLGALTVCDSYANVSQTSGTQIITGVSGRRTYICSLNLVSATAQNVAVVAGTGTVCATNTVAVPGTSGGATAATGWNFAANGGIALGGGIGSFAKTTVNADNVCVFQSGSGQLSGGISYAIY